MKAEDMARECPECGSKDKKISRTRNPECKDNAYYIPHVPEGGVGVIRCGECGYVFEYCLERKPPLEVKKILV